MTEKEKLFFDKLSLTWDDEEILSTPVRIENFLQMLDIRENMEVLDLGTGTGVLLPYLNKLTGAKGRILAIDQSTGMLEKARQKYGNLKNVAFQNSDFETQSIDGHFDLILLYCVYPHLHAPIETLSHLFDNNLKISGRIVIAFPTDENFVNNIHHERKSESELLPSAHNLSQTFVNAGFNSMVLHSSNPYVVIISK